MDLIDDMHTLTVVGAHGVKVEVKAEMLYGMAVYADPVKPERLRIATAAGKPLVKMLLTGGQALRALPLLDDALPQDVKSGEKSMTAWKREAYEAWGYYDRTMRHIIKSSQLGDWK